MERVFIAGFALCLLFLVVCGCAIGVEAYFLSTSGKLPPDLDNFIVQVGREGMLSVLDNTAVLLRGPHHRDCVDGLLYFFSRHATSSKS